MSQVITGLYEIPISAASAGYAPTNSADVTALIDTAVSGKLDASASSSFITSTADCMPLSASSNYATTGDLANKLDASASSSFQPVGNYVSSDDLSAYQTVDGMSAYQPSGSYQTAGNYVSSSELANYQTTAAMSAYATTDDLSSKLDASASSSFITSTAGLATTGDLAEKLDASASSSFVTSTADCMPLSASSDYYSTSNPAGYITGVDLTPYQTTAGMSAYATTGDLSAKLDASASSSFVTSTADCMPLSSSADYYSTSNPSGFVTSSYSPTFGYYNGNISSIDGTGLMGTDTAVVLTNTAQEFANIESGLPAEDTIIFDPPVTTIKITVPNELGTEPWLNLNADNPAGTQTVLPFAGSDSYYNYSTSLGGSGWTSISFDDPNYLSQGGIRYISATGYSDGVTSTAELMKLSAMSAYLPTSAIGVDTASSLITGINGSALSAGSTYSAGQYVQISGDEISVTGLQPSGSYASSTDLSAYQPTANMSAYATTGDLSAKLDASASSSFLTAQEQASWSETASASPSYIVDKPDLVDIVAGPGIVVDNPDGNTLRISSEYDAETVLWSGTKFWWNDTSNLQLSEAASHFEAIRVKARDDWSLPHTFIFFPGDNAGFDISLIGYEGGALAIKTSKFSVSGSTVSLAEKFSWQVGSDKTVTVNTTTSFIQFSEIVGIHRIANN